MIRARSVRVIRGGLGLTFSSKLLQLQNFHIEQLSIFPNTTLGFGILSMHAVSRTLQQIAPAP